MRPWTRTSSFFVLVSSSSTGGFAARWQGFKGGSEPLAKGLLPHPLRRPPSPSPCDLDRVRPMPAVPLWPAEAHWCVTVDTTLVQEEVLVDLHESCGPRSE